MKNLTFKIILIFLLTRLLNLGNMPIFIDEALYVGWTKAISNNWSNWLLPLIQDGQPPLFFWISSFLNNFISDTLMTLRLMSTFFGLLSILMGIKIFKLISKNSLSPLFVGIIFIVSPFILINDRLGMRDSAVTLSALMIFYGLAQRLIFNQKKSFSLYWIVSGLIFGLMIKSIAWFFPILIVSSYLLLRARLKIADYIALVISSLPFIFYYTTNTFSQLFNKNKIFLLDFNHPFSLVKLNLIQVTHWINSYLSIPVIILVAIGAYFIYQKNKKTILLFSLFTLPIFIFEVFFAKIFFPRYFLFSAVILLILASFGLEIIYKKLPLPKFILLTLITLFLNLNFSYKIIYNPINAPWPAIEKWQYISGWPSGYGLEFTAQKLINLKAESISTTDHLLTQGLKYYQPTLNLIPLDSSKADYLVTNLKPNNFSDDNLTLVHQEFRQDKQSSIDIYKIKEQ